MRTYKRVLISIFCFSFAFGSTINFSYAQSEKRILKFAHVQPETHIYHRGALKFSEKLAELSAGKMELQIFPNAIMGSEKAVLELLQLGSVDISPITTAITSSLIKELQMFSLPFLFDDHNHVCNTVDEKGFRDKLARDLNKKNLRPIGYWLSGSRNYAGKSPIRSIEDFKGKKIRTMQDPYFLKTFECFGALPVPMPFGELYMGLQTNLVQGTEIPMNTYIQNKFYEVAPHPALMNTIYMAMILHMSEITWAKLNSQQQKWILDASQSTEPYQRKITQEEEETSIKTLANLKLKPTIPDRNVLRKATEPVYGVFKKQFGDETFGMVKGIRTW